MVPSPLAAIFFRADGEVPFDPFNAVVQKGRRVQAIDKVWHRQRAAQAGSNGRVEEVAQGERR